MKTAMEMEILEQSRVIGAMIEKYVQNYVVMLDMPLIVRDIKIIASGSSYNCGQICKKFFEEIASVNVEVEFSGEFLCDNTKEIDKNTLHFFISQSGETFDSLEALKKVKAAGAKTYAIINNEDSSMYNLCDYKININSGVENSIAATKSFTASIMALYLCALKIGQNKLKDIKKHIKNINNVEKKIENVLDLTVNIEKAADFLYKYKNFPIVGLGVNYAIAREGALKIKETSYIDVNAWPMGEFLHGPVAILNNSDALIEIITNGYCELEGKTIKRVKNDYNPKSVVITDCEEDFGEKIAIVFPYNEDKIVTVLSVVFVLQMLALQIATKLKRNVDSPNGLSKVVLG